MRIQLLRPDSEGDYIFQISENKKTLLTSSDYQSRKDCLNQLQETLVTLRDNEQISIKAGNNNQYYFEVEHAQSSSYNDIEAASDVLVRLKEFAQSGQIFKVTYDRTSQKEVSKKQLGLREEAYNFNQKSKSGQSGFEVLIDESTNLKYFHFNDVDGKAILFSRSFDGNNKRRKAIRSVIKNAANENRLEVINADDKRFFILKSSKGYEIAKSKSFSSQTKLENALTFLQSEVQKYKQDFKLDKKAKKKRKNKKQPKAKEKYHLKQVAPLGLIGFEGFRSKKNKLHYFHFHDEIEQALLFSQPYESRSSRDEAILFSYKNGDKDKFYKTWKKSKNQYYFSLLGKNGKSYARSRYFSTKKEMKETLVQFQSTIKNFNPEVNYAPVTKQKTYKIELPEKEISVPVVPVVPIVATAAAITSIIPDKIEPEEIAETEAVLTQIEEVETEEEMEIEGMTEEMEGVIIEAEPVVEHITHPSPTRPPAPERVYETPKPNIVPPKSIIEEQPSKDFPWKWVLITLALIALLSLLRFCAMKEEVKPTIIAPKPTVEKPVEKPKPTPPAKLGKTAIDFNFNPATAEGKIADFLSQPKVSLPRTFVLESVQFPFNSAALTPTSNLQLDNVADVLKEYPQTKIEINGHTDNRGNNDNNLVLSQNRAESVQDYLIAQGIAANRIMKAIGFGENNPIATNDTDEGRQENRRSEVVVIER